MFQINCGADEYNFAAELWFSTPESIAQSLLHRKAVVHSISFLVIYMISYYLLAIVTSGAAISIGTFIPSVLIGAAGGRLWAIVWLKYYPDHHFMNPSKYALLGAAAFMGGLQRMTISAAIILMESTGASPSFAIPLIFTQMVAKVLADKLGHGLYEVEILRRNLPYYLVEPASTRSITMTRHIMNSPVICFRRKERVGHVYETLLSCTHHGFPVVEDVEEDKVSNGRLLGFILRHQVIVILLNSYYEEVDDDPWGSYVSLTNFRALYPNYHGAEVGILCLSCEIYLINFHHIPELHT